MKASTGPGRRLYLVGVYTVVAMVTLAVFPSSLLVTLVTGSHRIGHRLHSRLWGRLILALCGVSLRVHGLERLSGDRAYVLMCNHVSHFDGYAVAAALSLQWRAVLGVWIRPIPVFGWIGMLAGHVFLDRSRSGRAIRTLNQAVAKIRSGLSVLIFPEGTFNDGGPLSPFKRGGFHLAIAAGVPVVPMTVVETVVGPIRRVRAIDLYIGVPQATSGLTDAALPELMASVRAEMVRHDCAMSDDDSTVEWFEIKVPVLPAEATDVAGALTTTVAAAHGGVELRADAIVFWVRPADVEVSVSAARAAVTALSESGMLVEPAGVRVAAARPEHEWRDAWKRYFRTTRVSERLVIVPSWDTHVPRAGDTILEIDPGRAFGTGAHASTQLCLMELDALATRTRVERFLDVGTGSGILAIAAARLWPEARGVAVDTDPEAVEVATENGQRNGVAARVRCETTPLAMVPGTFELVMANIQADVLTTLRDILIARLTPGGTLVLSGLLSTEVESVSRAYAAVPGHRLMGVRRSATDPEWSCAVVTRI